MQWRAAIWITGTFYTSLSEGIEAIFGLIPIHLHLKKLYDRFLLRGFLLPPNHLIKSIINIDQPHNQNKHWLSIDMFTFKQVLYLKSPLVDMDNRYNEFLSAFAPLDIEFPQEIISVITSQTIFPSILISTTLRISFINLMTLSFQHLQILWLV